jgi:hypothetical protein
VDTNAKLNAALGWKTAVALHHAVLHFNGAAHCVDNAAEFNDSSVASALHHAPTVNCGYWVD